MGHEPVALRAGLDVGNRSAAGLPPGRVGWEASARCTKK